jgi:hypothetical protein
MTTFAFKGRCFILLAAAIVALASWQPADANELALANVVAAKGNQIPGQATGVTWGALNTPSVASDGRVLFSGSINGVPAVNNLGIFSGTAAANVAMMIQSGTQAPGGPAGATMDLNGSSSGLQATSAKINAGGVMSFVSLFTGGGSTPNVDNWGIFSGTTGSGFGMFVRAGNAAPGTVGAVFKTPFATSVASTPINSSGVGYFAAGLTGGDVSGTTNDNGIFGGAAGSLGLVARRGAAAPGVTGGTFGAFSNPIPMMANANGRLVFGNSLNQTGGVTSANDSVLYMHTPGAGPTLLAREGDAAPGTVGATYTSSFTMNAANLNNSSQALFAATLTGGDVSGTTNNSAFYIGTDSGAALAWRNGSAAPGTDANFLSASAFNMCIDNAGRIALGSTLTGGTVVSTNDSGIWYGAPGALDLILREGDAVPTLNATFGNAAFAVPRTNALGQLAVTVSMLSADPNLNNKTGLFAYDPGLGLFPIAYAGEQIEVAPGVFKTISSFTTLNGSNSDGAGFSFSDTGWLTLKLSTSDSTDVIVSYHVPEPTSLALLGLGGLLLFRRRQHA